MDVRSDTAYCLRQQAYSESSQIVTLFGRSWGKIRAISKGSRRAKGNFSGGIDLLHRGEVRFMPSRGESGLATLTEFNLTDAAAGLRRNFTALTTAQFAADLVAQFTADLDPHETLFEAFGRLLAKLPTAEEPLALLVPFEWVLLRETGQMPIWKHCAACRRDLGRRRLHFGSAAGGILCGDCEAAITEKRALSRRAWALLCRPQACAAAGRNELLEAHGLLTYHFRELMGKETPIMVFLAKLLREAAPGPNQRTSP